MPNRRAVFSQADVTRIAKAMTAAGVGEYRIVVEPTGALQIVVGKAAPGTGGQNPWDEVLSP